jgi:hypothetical protein
VVFRGNQAQASALTDFVVALRPEFTILRGAYRAADLQLHYSVFDAGSLYHALSGFLIPDLWHSKGEAIRLHHFDRGKLCYLNLLERINCAYCSYGNGLIAYVVEIAARTEQHCALSGTRIASSIRMTATGISCRTATRPPIAHTSRKCERIFRISEVANQRECTADAKECLCRISSFAIERAAQRLILFPGRKPSPSPIHLKYARHLLQ